jgi:tRNA pseudouridine55 synthase
MVQGQRVRGSSIIVADSKRKSLEGILLVNKPSGITSHDVVDIARKRLNIRRIGHAGTLDPLAEGLLILLVGKSTKLFSQFVNFDKEYIGILKLGQTTHTGDSQGQTLEEKDCSDIDQERIKNAFSKFEGEIDQVPPMVSALRIKGRRLYRLAHKGIVVKREPRRIRIYSLQVQEINHPLVKFYIHCSKGTYVRKVAQDIGEELGCGAHMVMIKRISVGPYKLDRAINLEEINEKHLQQFAP